MTDHTPNQQRATYTAELIDGSRHYHHGADDTTGVQDLLSDLMHLCRERGWDFTDILQSATNNFNSEVMDVEFGGRAA